MAVFAAASEAFSAANINCSIQESLHRFGPVMERAKAASLPVRGYVSCVLGCPYEGPVRPWAVAEVSGTGYENPPTWNAAASEASRTSLPCPVRALKHYLLPL